MKKSRILLISILLISTVHAQNKSFLGEGIHGNVEMEWVRYFGSGLASGPDIARAIGADLGVRVEFVNFGFDGLYDALRADQVDVVIDKVRDLVSDTDDPNVRRATVFVMNVAHFEQL